VKPVLSTMIRVGSNTSFSSNLNSFHSQSTQTSGFFTNAGSSGPPPPPVRLLPYVGWDFVEFPSITTNLDGKTLIVCNLSSGITPPETETVSSVYVEINCVSGGYNAVKSDGYSSILRRTSSRGTAVAIGAALTVGQNIYFRLDNTLPTPRTFSWYNGSAGNSPRDIVAVSDESGTFNPATKTCTALPGQTIDVCYIIVDPGAVRISEFFLGRTSVTGDNSSYSTGWSGSSLGTGGGGFRLIVVNRGADP